MNAQEVNSLIKNPELLGSIDADTLRGVCEKFPYFQVLQLLLCKKLHDESDFESVRQLRRAAVCVPSGRRLYKLLYEEKLRELIEENLRELEFYSEPDQPDEASFETPIPMKSLQKPHQVATQDESAVKADFDKPNDKAESETDSTGDGENLAAQLETEILKHAAQSAYYLRTESGKAPDKVTSKGGEKEIAKSKKEAPLRSSQKFGDWLKVLDSDKINELRKEERKKDAGDLIDEFIAKQPQISKADTGFDFDPTAVSNFEAVQDKEFVSETLAKIYEKQGNVSKALKIYRILMSKYPEKKSYFARQIQELEKK